MNLHIPPDLTLISQLHARATAATLAAAHRTPHAGSKLCVRATALLLLLLLISSLVAGRLANLQLHFTSRLLPGRLHISTRLTAPRRRVLRACRPATPAY